MSEQERYKLIESIHGGTFREFVAVLAECAEYYAQLSIGNDYDPDYIKRWAMTAAVLQALAKNAPE